MVQILTDVVFAEQLHPHHGEDEDYNTQHEGQVTQRSHRSTHDGYKQIQSGPGLCQFEYAKLQKQDYCVL